MASLGDSPRLSPNAISPFRMVVGLAAIRRATITGSVSTRCENLPALWGLREQAEAI